MSAEAPIRREILDVLPSQPPIAAINIIFENLHNRDTVIATVTEGPNGSAERTETKPALLYGPDAMEARVALMLEMMSAHLVVVRKPEEPSVK